MRRILALSACLAAGFASATFAGAFADDTPRDRASVSARGLIDLSHPFNDETIYWPTARKFKLTKVAEGETEGGYFYAANDFEAAEHGGTHLDAPVHFARGGDTADEIPLRRLVGKAIVVDVSKRALADPDYLISVADMRGWERRYGRISRRTIVLLHTGFGRYWPDAERYLGTAERGEQAVPKLHFPGLSERAAAWLVDRRSVKAVGIDTASIDRGQSTEFLAHRTLGAANVPVVRERRTLGAIAGARLLGRGSADENRARIGRAAEADGHAAPLNRAQIADSQATRVLGARCRTAGRQGLRAEDHVRGGMVTPATDRHGSRFRSVRTPGGFRRTDSEPASGRRVARSGPPSAAVGGPPGY